MDKGTNCCADRLKDSIVRGANNINEIKNAGGGYKQTCAYHRKAGI